MRLAIVAEKPSLLDAFAPLLPEFFPDADFARTPVFFPVYGWFKGTANRFRLPRGLKWSELPFISEPVYRQITFTDARAKIGIRKLVGQTYSMVESEAEQALADADVILALVDACYGGAHLAYRFISDALGYFPKGRVLYPWIVDISEKGQRKSLTEMRHFDEFAMPFAMQGEIRRYFDYNYLANALPIISAAARQAGTWGTTIPSKYGLQLLYDARGTEPLSDGHRIERMTKWKGTGKYKPAPGDYFDGLGSPTSRGQIIEELVDAHYLQRTSAKRTHTSITEEGSRFLELLHPDCQDLDLPFRLERWSHMPEAEAKEKINRYIRTFFGKQKSFFEKVRSEGRAA
jgi:hypothetical protein